MQSHRVNPLEEISFSLVKGHRLLVLNVLAYSTLVAVNAWNVPWTTQGKSAARQLFNREIDLPIVRTEIAIVAFLFLVYFSALLNWRRLEISTKRLATLFTAVVILAWLSVPGVTSADVYAYIAMGRLAGIHNLNPYLHGYREVHDAYTAYAWYPGVMRYGPVVLPMFMVAAWISSLSVLGAVFFLKLQWVAVLAVSAWVLWNLLRAMNRDAEYGVFVLALNPLVLLELIITGHNDGLVILFTLLSLFFAQRREMHLALWLALTAALVKVSIALLFTAVLVLAIRKRAWKQATLGLLGCVAVLIGLRLTILPPVQSWYGVLNPVSVINMNSLHAWLLELMSLPVRSAYLSRPLSSPRLIVDGIFVVFCIWRLTKIHDFASMVRESAYTTIGLLVIYSGQFYPSYLMWVIPFASVTDSVRLRRGILLYTCTALWLYAIPIYWVANDLRLRVVRWTLAHAWPLARLMWPANAQRSDDSTGAV